MVSGLYNAFLGQSLSQARLNVMDAYDQSNDLFYMRVLASADLGLSESYMMCDIDVDNLKGMMDVSSSSHVSI